MSAIRPIAFLLGTLAAILSAPTGQAQTFPKAGEVLRDSLGARVWQIGYRMTPTGYATLERSRETQLSMRYAYWDSEGLNAPFEGEGGERLRIEASGYGVQKDKSIYCAAASFSTGTLRRSTWNDVCDVWMLYPYTVADATGGDYLDEEYFLSGGYARYFGTHVLGLRVEYTGRVAFRGADPRPKNTVSDLSFNPGWSLRLGRGHTLGLFAKYRYYKQHVGISVEEPGRSYTFYRMRGVGLFDRMFSKGDTSFDRYYFSDEATVGGLWEKSGRNAFEAVLYFHYRSVRTEESDNRIPFLTRRPEIGLHAGYRRTMGASALTATLQGCYGRQQGWERTYERVTADEQTQVQVWRFLSQTLRDEISSAHARLRVEYLQGLSPQLSLWYATCGEYRYDREQFTSPLYHMQVSFLRLGAETGLRREGTKGNRMELRMAAWHKTGTGSSIACAEAENEIGVREMLLPLYEYLTRDYTLAEAAAAYTFVRRGFELKVHTEGGYAFGDGGSHRWGIRAGISVFL